MLKKIFVTALLMALSFIGSQIFSSNICRAIPLKEICLGGLSFMEVEDGGGGPNDPNSVRKMYGEPTSINRNVQIGENKRGDIWRYGDSVEIVFYDWGNFTEKEKYIASITVTANNGWKTPEGLAVGMKLDDAERMYGKADYIKSKGNKILYVYFGNPRWYSVNLSVLANKNDGKILNLIVHGSSMADLEQWFPRWIENILK